MFRAEGITEDHEKHLESLLEQLSDKKMRTLKTIDETLMGSLENVKLLLVSLAAKKRKMVANESMRIKSENHDHYRAFL